MKSSVEKINSVQRRITVELGAETVNESFESIYKNIQKTAKVQGFRPGKAPLHLIKKLYGNSVASEVGEKLVGHHLYTVLSEENLKPISSPVIEKLELPVPNKLFTFTAVIDIMPEINLCGYDQLSITCELFEVTEDAVDRELASLQRQYAKTKDLPEETEAAAGHFAVVSHNADQNGEPVQSLTTEKMPVDLGKSILFPELEKEIFGMKKGEKKTAQVKIPKDYNNKDLAEKTLTFNIELHELKEIILSNLDDEFAKDLNMESMDKLRSQVRTNLEQYAQQLRRRRLESLVLERLHEKTPFEIPPSIVDQVIDGMIRDRMYMVGKEELNKALFNSDLRNSLKPLAMKQAAHSLLLWQIAKKESIEVAEEEINEYYDKTMAQMGQSKLANDPKTKKMLSGRIKEDLTLSKAMDFLIKNTNITDLPAKI